MKKHESRKVVGRIEELLTGQATTKKKGKEKIGQAFNKSKPMI